MAFGCKVRIYFLNGINLLKSCTHAGELQLFYFASDSKCIRIISYVSIKLFDNIRILIYAGSRSPPGNCFRIIKIN